MLCSLGTFVSPPFYTILCLHSSVWAVAKEPTTVDIATKRPKLSNIFLCNLYSFLPSFLSPQKRWWQICHIQYLNIAEMVFIPHGIYVIWLICVRAHGHLLLLQILLAVFCFSIWNKWIENLENESNLLDGVTFWPGTAPQSRVLIKMFFLKKNPGGYNKRQFGDTCKLCK